MNYYANDEQRVRLVAGLRDLADFLDQNPDVPAPWELVFRTFAGQRRQRPVLGPA